MSTAKEGGVRGSNGGDAYSSNNVRVEGVAEQLTFPVGDNQCTGVPMKADAQLWSNA